MEANTVVYDSSQMTVEQMEEALRKANTYRKTFPEATGSEETEKDTDKKKKARSPKRPQ